MLEIRVIRIYVSCKCYCLHNGDFIFSYALKLLNLIRNIGWTGQDSCALGWTEIEWTEVVLARKKWNVVDITNLD